MISQFVKTVSTAGTAERLSDSDLWVYSFVCVPQADNTGSVYIGDHSIDNTATPIGPNDANKSFSWGGVGNGAIVSKRNLKNVWVDAAQNGDGIHVSYDQAE